MTRGHEINDSSKLGTAEGIENREYDSKGDRTCENGLAMLLDSICQTLSHTHGFALGPWQRFLYTHVLRHFRHRFVIL